MATISIVISAFNEEKKITDCLESVNWADEIVFVDNSSTDQTAKIAKKYKVKLFTRPNNPMLNVNKNYGIERATCDWVLYLDADEQVTHELQKVIKTLLNANDDSGVNGYWIPRKNIIFGKWIEHAGMYPDYQMRMIRKGKGRFPQKHVHEMIDVNGKTAHLKEDLLHYNFETVSQFLYKHVELYAPNEADVLVKDGYKLAFIDAIRMPAAEFLSRFFARQGYKDGLHGLVLSSFLAFYHLVIFAKIWERELFKEYNSPQFLDSVSGELKREFSENVYWIANEKLKRSKSFIEQTLLRVERKLKS